MLYPRSRWPQVRAAAVASPARRPTLLHSLLRRLEAWLHETPTRPRTLEIVQREALARAESQGHVLDGWRLAAPSTARTRCRACGAELTLHVHARVASTDGDALLEACDLEYLST